MITIRKDLVKGYVAEHIDSAVCEPAPCITRSMTAEEQARWGKPVTKVCPGCGEELVMSAFTHGMPGRITKYCRPCFDRRREGERNGGR